jgi:hypothetical protein
MKNENSLMCIFCLGHVSDQIDYQQPNTVDKKAVREIARNTKA